MAGREIKEIITLKCQRENQSMTNLSNKKGSYYKYRTKSWAEKKGYQVAFMEKTLRIYAKGKVIPVKQDQLASDLLLVSEDEIIFVQVKLNKKNIAKGITDFHKYIFPKFVKKWLIIWIPRAREPEIIEV